MSERNRDVPVGYSSLLQDNGESPKAVGSAKLSDEDSVDDDSRKGSCLAGGRGDEWCSARAQFFSELRQLLQESDLKEALWWQPRDRTIVIHPDKFEKLVLPKYVRTRKFASFQRRLNRW